MPRPKKNAYGSGFQPTLFFLPTLMFCSWVGMWLGCLHLPTLFFFVARYTTLRQNDSYCFLSCLCVLALPPDHTLSHAWLLLTNIKQKRFQKNCFPTYLGPSILFYQNVKSEPHAGWMFFVKPKEIQCNG